MRVLGALLLALLVLAPRAAETGQKQPNILWLIAEDFGPHLGCYGTEQVWTPNLDRLAAEGVRYTRAFTTNPVCSPSRSAFMTGMYQTTIGAHHHRSHRDDGYRPPDISPPWYFNSGCCSFGDGDVTGLEIDRGTIRLVRWLDNDGNAAPQRLAEADLVALLAEIA